jgi:hypothetical protein
MSAGNVARVVAVLLACAAAAGSATSTSSSNQKQFAGPGAETSPPQPQQMEPGRALGLWHSNFGAVKIEPDGSKGGLEAGNLHGIWVYQRGGHEVIGYFAGNLRGNVLQFRWQEPSDPSLAGEGFVVFDVQGQQYSGRWWSDRRDRVGDWTGSRQSPTGIGGGDPAGAAGGAGGHAPREVNATSPYGGQGYGGPEGNPYRRPQGYRPQSSQQPPKPPQAQPQQTYF